MSFWSTMAMYAVTFSFAYISLGAASCALVLFAVVQTVVLSVAMSSGERPGIAGIAGLALAFAGLIALLGPGISRPNPIGAFLMFLAGLARAGYTARGRGSKHPLLVTAGNFLLALPLALVPWLLHLILNPKDLQADVFGIIQLAPAHLATLGGLHILGEPITAQLVLASILFPTGVLVES